MVWERGYRGGDSTSIFANELVCFQRGLTSFGLAANKIGTLVTKAGKTSC
jgi:hypothetical protein